jgi:hypothetical protein
MVAIAYGTGAYRRSNGNLPELKLKNMFLETSPTSDQGVTLISRQGLSTYLNPGTGPVTGVFYQNNVFSGDVFCVSGGHLYRNTTDLGAVGGSGYVHLRQVTATN